MNFFEIRDLSFRYQNAKEWTMQNFNLSISQGQIVGVLGRSGSGKSTLLRLIAGLEEPAGGTITIAGVAVVGQQKFVEPEERGVGMVFQDYALFPHITVSQNIVFGLHRLSRAERAKRLDEMLELVQLRGYERRYPHELSGGQQQRVALARALAPKPAILLMDEPFSNLDADLKGKIRQELKEILNRAKMTCIFVTHDNEDVDAICDRVVYMEAGG
ncbi:ABC transporter ATP-binding protein [Brevibacillus massiliensis]|jgi:iron(III) transport system ATP-binding protein|uniref:ABC transporter ATP-binding protein n=1 Tax=Brevibacillus massiliensis TaxID=1118054 RepID=UPI0003186E8C|nr:ABC transporter ATP-binding protein [Brevibacillus massiliensis]